jgi:hypothetical protein
MATRKKKTQTPDQLIAEIKAWAISNHCEDDALVVALLADLESGQDLDAWASLDSLEILPAVEYKSGDKLLRITNLIAIARNILVFVPVALTWIAVSKATTAFEQYTAANPTAVVNFLEFWQNGYGLLSKDWIIGHVAFLAGAIIAVVIALSMTVSVLELRHKKSMRTTVAVLDKERLTLALKIFKYLHSHKSATPAVVNAGIAGAVRNLLATSKEMAKASKELAKDLKKSSLGK